jgi:hypothetical protein
MESTEGIMPYITKEEVKAKVKELLRSKGYLDDDIRENVIIELDEDVIVSIDVLVKLSPESGSDSKMGEVNRILILCDSPSETITLATRLAVLISKLLDPPPRMAIATNWMESEVVDLLTNRKWYSLEIPTREEMKEMRNPVFDFSEDHKEKIKKVVSGLYSMRCTKCGIRF